LEDSVKEDSCVDTVGSFTPTYFGFDKNEKGRRPSDYA